MYFFGKDVIEGIMAKKGALGAQNEANCHHDYTLLQKRDLQTTYTSCKNREGGKLTYLLELQVI